MSFLDLRPTAEPAIVDGDRGEVTTAGQLLTEATALGRRFGDGKRLCMLLSRNDHFSVTVYAGSQLAGHALMLADGSRPPSDHAAAIHAYSPDVIAGPVGLGEALAALGLDVTRVASFRSGELAFLEGSAQRALHPDLALLLGTSGTTGSSRYVRLSAANIEANARSIASYIGITPRERPITSLPLHYSFGLSVLNSHWIAGAAVVLSTGSVLERSFWATVDRLRCTSLAGVPYTYQLLERIGYRKMDLPSLSTMQQAGGALDRSLTMTYDEHMRAKDGRFFVMYGQTEATARIAYVPPERLSEKVGSAGVAIPGGRLRIEAQLDERDRRVDTGEVVYEGPNVMLGYATRGADLALGDELAGVLHTGDLGYLDEDGFLFLTGRRKRIAKVFGQRVSLDEVELMLREGGPAAVVAEDDLIRGYCAFGSDADIAALGVTMSRRLRLHQSALELRRVDAIPVTSTGKVDYREVERWASS